ncbi:hypothetical protein [Phenylobacterium sp.]|uniref:hypothetical protein n=1 Tax=Phenylobacterium sp. TaxID=1871053 RepID=UPI002FE2EACB
MTARRWGAVLTVTAVVTAASAVRAQTSVAELELRDAIAKACKPAPDLPTAEGADGAISAADLGAAISKRAPVTVRPAWLRTAGVPLPKLVATAAFGAEEAGDPNIVAYSVLRSYSRSWLSPAGTALPLRMGGVLVRGPAGETVDAAQSAAVLETILAGSGPYVFRCTTTPPARPDGTGPRRPEDRVVPAGGGDRKAGFRWALGKTPADLAKGVPEEVRAADDTSFAEFGFTDDSVKDVESYAINATTGLVFEERGVGKTWGGKPLVFLELQRQGTDVPVEGGYVNNLNLGVGFAGRASPVIGGRERHFYFDLAGKLISDDDFHARAYKASLAVDPPLPLPGYRVAWPLQDAGDTRIFAWWSLAGVVDWMQVDDPGEKVKLQTAPEFTRLGYDLAGHVMWLPRDPRRKMAVQFDAAYALRDGQTEDGGDAQLVTVGLRWLPEPRFSIGVAYERGENLDTLERIDIWKFVAGARF